MEPLELRPSILFYSAPPDAATVDIHALADRYRLNHVFHSWHDGDPLPAFDALIVTTLPLEHFEQMAPRSALIRTLDKREWPKAAE